MPIIIVLVMLVIIAFVFIVVIMLQSKKTSEERLLQKALLDIELKKADKLFSQELGTKLGFNPDSTAASGLLNLVSMPFNLLGQGISSLTSTKSNSSKPAEEWKMEFVKPAKGEEEQSVFQPLPNLPGNTLFNISNMGLSQDVRDEYPEYKEPSDVSFM